MANGQYQHWEGNSDKGTVVLQDELNEVHIPRRLKGALQNHYYGKAIDPKSGQEIMAYIPVTYEHKEYPKMLYHPKFGQGIEPKLTDYAAGCTTPEQSIKAHEAYKLAYEKWQKSNRVKVAENAEQEKYFLDKGWKVEMPKPVVRAGSNESDEI